MIRVKCVDSVSCSIGPGPAARWEQDADPSEIQTQHVHPCARCCWKTVVAVLWEGARLCCSQPPFQFLFSFSGKAHCVGSSFSLSVGGQHRDGRIPCSVKALLRQGLQGQYQWPRDGSFEFSLKGCVGHHQQPEPRSEWERNAKQNVCTSRVVMWRIRTFGPWVRLIHEE